MFLSFKTVFGYFGLILCSITRIWGLFLSTELLHGLRFSLNYNKFLSYKLKD